MSQCLLSLLGHQRKFAGRRCLPSSLEHQRKVGTEPMLTKLTWLPKEFIL